MEQCCLLHHVQMTIKTVHISQQGTHHRFYLIGLNGCGQSSGNTHRHTAKSATVFLTVGKHKRMDGTDFVEGEFTLLTCQLLHIFVGLFVTNGLKMILQGLLVDGDAL